MKKKMLLTIVAVFCVAMFGVSSANAVYLPNAAITTVESYLGGSYFNGYSVVTSKTFSGDWQYTAIAYESANLNITDEGGAPTFSTGSLSNWGTWDDVTFSENSNIYFQDMTDGPRVAFNPYSGVTTQFKLFLLAEDSDTLTYLNNPLSLSLGTYIIGWNDNTATGQGNDGDYDDIIIAMREKPVETVPEPTSMLLLGLGLVGLAGMSRRFKK